MTKKQRMPPGWTEQEIRALAKRHDAMSDDDIVAEIDAGLTKENQTVMVVPTELVPEINRMIAEKVACQEAAGVSQRREPLLWPGNHANGAEQQAWRERCQAHANGLLKLPESA